MSLSLFLAITYVLCVGFDLIFPAQAMHANWERLLPGARTTVAVEQKKSNKMSAHDQSLGDESSSGGFLTSPARAEQA
jgi:hypothetical protein